VISHRIMMQAAAFAVACATPCVMAPMAIAQEAAAVAPRAMVPVSDAVYSALSARLFPLFTALGQNSEAQRAFIAKPEIAAIMAARAQRVADCGDDTACVAQALNWLEREIVTIGAALPAALPSFDDGIAEQARRELLGVNVILGTYGLGKVPFYPAIDGAGTISPRERASWLMAANSLSQLPRTASLQSFDRAFDFALALLDNSTRTDAIGFYPLASGGNAPGFAEARKTRWSHYRYSALVIPGAGPEMEGMPLSPGGKLRLRLAAEQFARGDAAFIIVSGGRAHPFGTPFVEAHEMRQTLIERYGIPANRIIMDGHARHTTTNMRNIARLLIEMGAPQEKPVLVVSAAEQVANIASDAFAARNEHELGYAPGKAGKRLSPTALEWTISAASLRIDPRDPLDP
jgi:hypothetical protein